MARGQVTLTISAEEAKAVRAIQKLTAEEKRAASEAVRNNELRVRAAKRTAQEERRAARQVAAERRKVASQEAQQAQAARQRTADINDALSQVGGVGGQIFGQLNKGMATLAVGALAAGVAISSIGEAIGKMNRRRATAARLAVESTANIRRAFKDARLARDGSLLADIQGREDTLLDLAGSGRTGLAVELSRQTGRSFDEIAGAVSQLSAAGRNDGQIRRAITAADLLGNTERTSFGDAISSATTGQFRNRSSADDMVLALARVMNLGSEFEIRGSVERFRNDPLARSIIEARRNRNDLELETLDFGLSRLPRMQREATFLARKELFAPGDAARQAEGERLFAQSRATMAAVEAVQDDSILGMVGLGRFAAGSEREAANDAAAALSAHMAAQLRLEQALERNTKALRSQGPGGTGGPLLDRQGGSQRRETTGGRDNGQHSHRDF